MNEARLELVAKAFDLLDKTDDGTVTLEDLRGVYSVLSHPQYLSGEMSEDDLLKSFIKKFENCTTMDGKVKSINIFSSN